LEDQYQDYQVTLENQDKMVRMELMELMVQMEIRANQVLLVALVLRDLLALLE